MSITMLVAAELQQCYDLFNREFFDGKLPSDVYLGFRHKLRSDGLFLEEKWERPQIKNHHELLTDENLIATRDLTNLWMEFVHQMARVWQCEFGKTKPRKGYNNKELAEKLREIGLVPTSHDSNRKPESGIGSSVSLSIEPNGRFEQVMKEHKKELKLSIKPRNAAAQIPDDSKSGKRWKYSCPKCGVSTTGKQGLKLGCIPCNMPLQEQAYNYKK